MVAIFLIMIQMNETEFSARLFATFSGAGITLSDKQVQQFLKYWQLLLGWNSRAGLISKNDESRILERHFLESAVLSKISAVRFGVAVIDVGTGGGFPGLPLKIVRPDLEITLLDSRRWKTLFLKNLNSQLGLNCLQVVCGRAELINKDEKFKSRYDLVVCRAVSELKKSYFLAREFLNSTGIFLTLKGSSISGEINDLKKDEPDVSVEVTELPEMGLDVSSKLKVVILRSPL